MKFAIVPVTVWPNQASTIEIHSVSISLGAGASCGFSLLDSAGNSVLTSQASLTPEQYEMWGSDDSYFTDCILINLNITLAPVVEPDQI